MDYDELAAQAGVDPWTLRNDLVSGSPVEITAMAQAFARAAGDAELAAQLTREGADLVAAGYTVDGTSAIDPEDHVARTRAQLGDDGADFRTIARLLDTISDDLETKTADAVREVDALEADLRAIDRRYAESVRNLPDEDRVTFKARALADAVEAVRTRGATVRGWHDAYDEGLARHLRTLADLGYVPPDDADLGGDVGDVSPEQARRDGAAVRDAVDRDPPDREGLEQIRNASQTVELLNAKAAAGERLSAEEIAYLETYYDAIGADALADLPAYVRDAAPTDIDRRRGPDGSPLRTTDDVIRETLSPIADGIMVLSDQPVTGYQTGEGVTERPRGLYDMPRAVQDLARQEIGSVDAHGQRWPNRSVAPDDLSPDGMQVAGLARYRGFADLLAASSVDGGERFSHDIAVEALRAKQQLNQATEMYSEVVTGNAYVADDEHVAALRAATHDGAMSTLLGVAARNEDAAAGLLTDERTRETLLGLNWYDETGAAAVVRGGTDRDPAGGGGTQAQADAALAVIREVGGDRDAYLARMGENVEDAVTDVGLTYIDLLARDTTDLESAPRPDLEDDLGRPLGPGFELTAADRDRYLQFVAGTAGEDEWHEDKRPKEGNDLVRFQAGATAYSTVLLTDAMRTGDAAQVDLALKTAGRLDGAVTSGSFNYSLQQDLAEEVAAGRAEAAQNAAAKSGVVIGAAAIGGLATIATGGAATPAAVIMVGTAIAAEAGNHVFAEDGATEEPTATTRAALFNPNDEATQRRRDSMLVVAAANAGIYEGGASEHAPPVVRGHDGAYYLDTPADRPADSTFKQRLGEASTRLNEDYSAKHGDSETDINPGTFTEGRSAGRTTEEPVYDTTGESRWSTADTARDLLYGDGAPRTAATTVDGATVTGPDGERRAAEEHEQIHPDYYDQPHAVRPRRG